jgi:hypothetical protein
MRESRHMKRQTLVRMLSLIVLFWATVILMVILITGCGQVEKQDAKRTERGNIDDSAPQRVINMPETFPNVVMKCDGRGHMVYVTSRRASPIVVLADPNCPKLDR